MPRPIPPGAARGWPACGAGTLSPRQEAGQSGEAKGIPVVARLQFRAVDGSRTAAQKQRAEAPAGCGNITGEMAALTVVFMGTPSPVLPVLDAVHRTAGRNGWAVAAVYTAPDRPSGRGRTLSPSPVGPRAAELGIPVRTPARLDGAEQAAFRELGADLVVLAAYGLLLPAPFLDGPRHGAVNVHPSLLPKHRGAAPVAGAILAGDRETGTSLIVMDEGLDTGPLLAQERVPLDGTERTPQLTSRLFDLGAAMLERLLPEYIAGWAAASPQPEEGASLTRRMSKADGEIDWADAAVCIERKVRAYDPWPGAATSWEGRRVTVVDAALAEGVPGLAPGEVSVMGGEVTVGAGEGALRLLRVKLEGRPEADAAAFVRGHAGFRTARLPS